MGDFVVFTSTGARHITNKRLKFFRNRFLPVVKNPDLVHVKGIKEIFWTLNNFGFIVEMPPDEKYKLLEKLSKPHKSYHSELYPLWSKALFWLFSVALISGCYLGYLKYGKLLNHFFH